MVDSQSGDSNNLAQDLVDTRGGGGYSHISGWWICAARKTYFTSNLRIFRFCMLKFCDLFAFDKKFDDLFAFKGKNFVIFSL